MCFYSFTRNWANGIYQSPHEIRFILFEIPNPDFRIKQGTYSYLSSIRYILGKCKFFVRKRTVIKDITINTLNDVYRAIEETKSYNGYRLWIPIEKVCMHGAFRYGGGWHPFVSFFENGVKELESFYEYFTPENLAQMYFLPESDKGYDLPLWELPWVPRNSMSKPADEGGLSLEEHGAPYFGPVSSEKLVFECKRLTTVLKSIKKKGYYPPPPPPPL